jgi:hypothetical protein
MGVQSDRGVSNLNYTQVEALVTAEQVKKEYLFGLEDFVDEKGNIADAALVQKYINAATSWLEHELDIAIMPRKQEEHKDYYANDYVDWGYISLNRIPVISIDQMRVVYMRGLDQSGNVDLETVLDIPANWIRLDPDTGIIRLIPNNKFPARLQVDSGGSFWPELFRRHQMVPNMWVVNYTWGFRPGCIPLIINQIIGMYAATLYLYNISDVAPLGAGVAAASIGMDGLSQSITTTASAENMTLQAKIRSLQQFLFGDKTKGMPGLLEAAKNYYKGVGLQII